MTHLVDLHFMGHPQAIAAYVVPHARGVIVVDPGPSTCAERLDAELAALGYSLSDVTDVLLTHIHFDHAGAAWRFADAGATVHVHPLGYGHLADPSRLWGSAARIYGEEGMASLWGEMRAIPESRLRQWADGETDNIENVSIESVHSPGHAKHHIAWRVANELFLGDVGGVRVGGGPVEPPCPPPDIDLEAWRISLAKLRSLDGIAAAYRTHFGRVESADLPAAYDELGDGIDRWLGYVQDARKADSARVAERFISAVEREREPYGPSVAQSYSLANPAFMSVTGLLRYLDKHRVGSS